MRKYRIAPVVLSIVLLAANLAAACPSCKDSIADTANMSGPGGPSGGLPAGFNYSVYLLLTGFFVVLGMVLRVIVKAVRATPSGTPSGPRGFAVRLGTAGAGGAAGAATSPRS